MPITLFLVRLLAVASVALARPQSNNGEGHVCTLPNGRSGTCRKLRECRSVLQNVTRGIYDHERCGFDQFLEVVCCVSGDVGNSRLEVSAAAGRRSQKECQKYRSKKNNLTYYIRGGEFVDHGDFPHMAALGYQVKGARDLAWMCGGSLLSDRYVLTAAHCVDTTSAHGVLKVVRLGYTNLETDADTGADYEVEEVILHPQFKHNAYYYDLALLRLRGRVQFSRWVYPACLFARAQDPPGELIITGWGDTSGTGLSPSPHMMKAMLRAVPLQACSRNYKADGRIPRGVLSDMICAGGKERKDTCRGDSGGPLQVLEDPRDSLYSVVGVTSFGPSPCGGKRPGVYTRVASFLPWIERIVWG